MGLTGAQQLALTLAKHAVTTVFTVPGGHCLPLLAALEELGIHTIGARHEQGAGFMAEAWARVTSTPGVVVTTAGPGVTNVLTPLAQAHAESVPMCVLALDNYSSTLSDADGQFHGITDMRSAVTPFADWVGCATGPDVACQLVQAAFARLARGRPRPVLIQLPSDTLTAAYPDQVPEATPPAQQDDDADLNAADTGGLLACLDDAKRVVIFAGAGSVRSGAGAVLQQLAEMLAAPVVTTVSGRGAIPDDHPLALGPVWDRFGPLDDLAREADLVLCVGTRLTPLATRNGTLPLHGRVALINTDTSAPARSYPPRVSIQADAKAVLGRLISELASQPGYRSAGQAAFADSARTLAARWRATFTAGAPMAADLLGAIRQATPRDTVFCCDMTVLGYWAQRFLPVLRPGGLLSPYYFGSLGYGLPAALGARVGAPDATVLALCGDGGFLMNSQEMATANQAGIVVHVVIIDDGGYGAVRADERRSGLPSLRVSSISNPDFAKLAAAYGWDYAEVPAVGAELAEVLRCQVGNGRPSIGVVRLNEPLPMPYEISW